MTNARRQEEAIFLLFIRILSEQLARNDTGQPFGIMIWIYHYLLNGIGLELGPGLLFLDMKNT